VRYLVIHNSYLSEATSPDFDKNKLLNNSLQFDTQICLCFYRYNVSCFYGVKHKTGMLHRYIGLLSSLFATYFIKISYSISPAVVGVSYLIKQMKITSMSLLLTSVVYCNAMLGTFPQKKKKGTH
jgi:hypothetical protein